MSRPLLYDLVRRCYAMARTAASPAERDAWIRRGAALEADIGGEEGQPGPQASATREGGQEGD